VELGERVLADRLVLVLEGRFRSGGTASRTCRRDPSEMGFRRTLGASASLLGHIFALKGRVADAVEVLEQGVREADTFETTWLRCPRLHFLGEAYLLAGQLEQAKRTADHALSLARERGERGFEAWILRLEAEIAGPSGRGDDAGAVYRAALALAAELECAPSSPTATSASQALPANRRTAGGAGAPQHREDDVPRHGHDVLAGAGRGADEAAGVKA
jgi:ATP/maltotriose-dependent transcriptional regulator MalT